MERQGLVAAEERANRVSKSTFTLSAARRVKMADRELLEAVLARVEELAFAMRPPNQWTPQFVSLVVAARQEMNNRDSKRSLPTVQGQP